MRKGSVSLCMYIYIALQAYAQHQTLLKWFYVCKASLAGFFSSFQTLWMNVVLRQQFKALGLHLGYISSCIQLNCVCSMHFKKFLVSWQIKIHELEQNLREQKQRIEQLERKKVSWKASAVSGKRSRTPEGEVTSPRDISKKKEPYCSICLGNGTVNSDDVPSIMPVRDAFCFWSRGMHTRGFLLL